MYRKLSHTVKKIVGYLLLGGLTIGCTEEKLGTTSEKEYGSVISYVSLHFVFPQGTSTRANPVGGEQGDGNEFGQAYENTINNVTLFFYPADNNGGINGDDVLFTATCYVNNITFSTVGPLEMEGLKMNIPYRVLAVANAGDLSSSYTSLNDLRNATLQDVYQSNNGTYNSFVMASENDDTKCVLTIEDGNSQSNPATATIDLERLAARVDYRAESSYTLDDNQRTATITRAMLVNLYNQPTYILKRVATDANGTDLTYLGDETTQNYVIDPNTASKTVPATDETAGWYDRYFPNLTDEVGSDGKTAWEGWLAKGDEITNPDDNTKWLRIGYAKENTSSIDAQGENYSTGVVFEAEYDNLGQGFTKGKTFFRVNKSTLYSSLEAAMEAHDTDFDFAMNFASFDDLDTYRSSLDGNDPAGYKDYLLTAKAGESSYEQYQWNNFKQNVLGYSGTDPTAKTRQVLHERTDNKTETFLGGRGYYTYWIKHNCGEASASVPGLPMENAIVRNNIYKLTVKSISKIGSDIPKNEEPEEPKVSIEVKLDDSWYVVYDMEVEIKEE